MAGDWNEGVSPLRAPVETNALDLFKAAARELDCSGITGKDAPAPKFLITPETKERLGEQTLKAICLTAPKHLTDITAVVATYDELSGYAKSAVRGMARILDEHLDYKDFSGITFDQSRKLVDETLERNGIPADNIDMAAILLNIGKQNHDGLNVSTVSSIQSPFMVFPNKSETFQDTMNTLGEFQWEYIGPSGKDPGSRSEMVFATHEIEHVRRRQMDREESGGIKVYGDQEMQLLEIEADRAAIAAAKKHAKDLDMDPEMGRQIVYDLRALDMITRNNSDNPSHNTLPSLLDPNVPLDVANSAAHRVYTKIREKAAEKVDAKTKTIYWLSMHSAYQALDSDSQAALEEKWDLAPKATIEGSWRDTNPTDIVVRKAVVALNGGKSDKSFRDMLPTKERDNMSNEIGDYYLAEHPDYLSEATKSAVAEATNEVARVEKDAKSGIMDVSAQEKKLAKRLFAPILDALTRWKPSGKAEEPTSQVEEKPLSKAGDGLGPIRRIGSVLKSSLLPKPTA
ncbi:MAG: hypothetical protein IPI58_05035 [Alphaproteobacteria bacterium]|nr:MAG: hypothetical protein IPI58_05035 [Alphaproteobacteria bacterium]